MKLISSMICVLLLAAMMLSSSGCCVVAGYGMKNAKEKRAAREAAFHARVEEAMRKASP